MSAIKRILSMYNATDESHIFHTILGTILQNLQQVPEQSIADLAASCFTVPSSISRVVHSLGYRNFTEFKYDLGTQLKNYGFENRLYPRMATESTLATCSEYLFNIVETVQFFQCSFDLSQILHASALLAQASRIQLLYCGEGTANILPLQCELCMAHKQTDFFSRPAELKRKLSQLGPDCCTLIILESNNEDYGSIVTLLPLIYNAGAQLLLVISDVNPLFDQVHAYTIRYPRDMTLNSFLYCQICLNLLTIAFRDQFIDQASAGNPDD